MAEVKAEVAREVLRGERTVAELGANHRVYPPLITARKKKAVEGLAAVFSGKAQAADATREGGIEKLHARIGQLVVEWDVLHNRSSDRCRSAARPSTTSPRARRR